MEQHISVDELSIVLTRDLVTVLHSQESSDLLTDEIILVRDLLDSYILNFFERQVID